MGCQFACVGGLTVVRDGLMTSCEPTAGDTPCPLIDDLVNRLLSPLKVIRLRSVRSKRSTGIRGGGVRGGVALPQLIGAHRERNSLPRVDVERGVLLSQARYPSLGRMHDGADLDGAPS